jgi:REP element-mobilizing transposase RayT
LGKVIRRLKARVSREAGFKVWQPNYYEHVIRNEKALNRIREYIKDNPTKEIIEFEQFYKL